MRYGGSSRSTATWMIRGYAIGLAVGDDRPDYGTFFAAAVLRGHRRNRGEFFGTAFWIGFTLQMIAAEILDQLHEAQRDFTDGGCFPQSDGGTRSNPHLVIQIRSDFGRGRASRPRSERGWRFMGCRASA